MDFLNPSSPDMWQRNFVLSGRSRDYRVYRTPGTLSVKTVLTGTSVWTTSEGRFPVSEDTFLIVNAGQVYDIEILSREPARTFCAFLAPGFVERIAADTWAQDLDEVAQPRPMEFPERLNLRDNFICPAIHGLRRSLGREPLEAEEAFLELGSRLASWRRGRAGEQHRLPFSKASTRSEIYRRLNRARDAMLSDLAAPWDLKTMAAAAFMSEFHFQRCFAKCCGLSPSAFLRQARVAKAQRLLTRNYGVAESALAVGYSSPTSFAAAFRRVTGCAPSEMREKEC